MLEHVKEPMTLNPYVPVSGKTPPTFIVQAENDPIDPIEDSLVYFEALRKAKVPAELHVFSEGGHAFGLRPTDFPVSHWPELAEKWLKTLGIIKK